MEITGGAVTYNILQVPIFITNNLVHCISSNLATQGLINKPYMATITADEGYTLEGATVSVIMNNVDVTNSVYSNGVINIRKITGDISISIVAVFDGAIPTSAQYFKFGTPDSSNFCSVIDYMGQDSEVVIPRTFNRTVSATYIGIKMLSFANITTDSFRCGSTRIWTFSNSAGTLIKTYQSAISSSTLTSDGFSVDDCYITGADFSRNTGTSHSLNRKLQKLVSQNIISYPFLMTSAEYWHRDDSYLISSLSDLDTYLPTGPADNLMQLKTNCSFAGNLYSFSDGNNYSVGSVAKMSGSSVTKVTLLDNIRWIGTSEARISTGYGFTRCRNLNYIDIPTSVQNIYMDCFQDCNLLEIDIPSSISVIPFSCFSSCVLLTKVQLPEGLSIIQSAAFRDCRSLPNIILPSTIVEIGDYAFEDLYSASYIKCLAEIPPTIGSGVFGITDSTYSRNYVIYVPDNSVDDYKQATNWASYADIIKPISQMPTT